MWSRWARLSSRRPGASTDAAIVEVGEDTTVFVTAPTDTPLQVDVQFRLGRVATVTASHALTARAGCQQVAATEVRCPGVAGVGVDGAHVRGSDRRDEVQLSAEYAVFATLEGGGGNDLLVSDRNPGRTRFIGGAGDDTLEGSENSVDYFFADPGADSMRGGVPHDTPSDDTVDYSRRTAPVTITNDGNADDGEKGEGDFVDSGITTLIGGAGNDTIKLSAAGARGRGWIEGRAGNDRIEGSPYPDRIYAGSGNNRVAAGRGDDYVSGGSGRDVLEGGDGRDWIIGFGGDDTIKGNAGDDVLHGGTGADKLKGGAGNDRLAGNQEFPAPDGARDIVACSEGDDRAFVGVEDTHSDCERTDAT